MSSNHKSKTNAGLFRYGDSKLVFTGRLMLKHLIGTLKYLSEESKTDATDNIRKGVHYQTIYHKYIFGYVQQKSFSLNSSGIIANQTSGKFRLLDSTSRFFFFSR